MMKILAAAAFALLVYGAVSTASQGHEGYTQTSCEIIDNDLTHSAAISVATPADIREGRALLYDVEFQPQGPLIRLPPQYYAPAWKDIDHIAMEYPSADADAGILSMRIKGIVGEYKQPVGKVKRACWNSVRAYIERKFPDHSPIVERVENR